MRIGGLYFRMLVVFVVVQLVAMLTMFSLVKLGKIRPPFVRHAEERTASIKRVVQHELAGLDAISPEKKKQLDSILNAFASAFQGQVWITANDGSVISSSFTGDIPLWKNETIHFKQTTPNGDSLYLLERQRHKNMYMVGSIPFQNEKLTVHLLHQWKKRQEEVWFMEGLLLMSVIAALLLIPLSRPISRPLRELTDSARQVGRGDFTPRVKSKWSGEISVLAKAFNHMAESVERMVRGGQELTANLSHELRSPLARIRISQQIIQERIESGRTEGIQKHVNKMETEIVHMDELIDKILKLSKLDLQEAPLRDDVINIADMLDTTISRHQPLVDEKSILVAYEKSHAPAYRCNRDNLQLALNNVLANAIKYSPDNSTITISSTGDTTAITITVINPYPPLSQKELETIFIPFKRLGYDDVEGNGLGLAFAKKIIEEHGGIMEASNAPNGFCMTLYLPV